MRRWSVAAGMIALLAVPACEREAPTDGPAFPLPRSWAPDLRLPVLYDPTGARRPDDVVRLVQQRGHFVVLSFWALSCGECILKHPEIAAFAAAHRADSLEVFGVLMNTARDDGLRWLKAHDDTPYPTLFNKDRQAEERYWIHGYPQMYLLDPQGRVASRCLGCFEFTQRFDAVIDSIKSAAIRGQVDNAT